MEGDERVLLVVDSDIMTAEALAASPLDTLKASIRADIIGSFDADPVISLLDGKLGFILRVIIYVDLQNSVSLVFRYSA